jgi:hypothetical protein
VVYGGRKEGDESEEKEGVKVILEPVRGRME